MARRGVPIGCGGIILVILFTFVFGGDPQQLLEVIGDVQSTPQGPPGGPSASLPGSADFASDELGIFASVVLADTEETWDDLLPQIGTRYREPTLVLFSNAVQSACGYNSAAVGPFYCPADYKVYLDLGFFNQLERRFGAPGDFAQAYVIAHEVGHHVQNILGISDQVQDAHRRSGQNEANALSVRMELQADCLAGVWAHHAHRQRQLLEPGDVEEGLRAAAAIGDDAIQTRTAGYTRPESWTHGSSDQRVTWLRRGLESGDPNACDTFGR
jgi:predicted metalloprotease